MNTLNLVILGIDKYMFLASLFSDISASRFVLFDENKCWSEHCYIFFLVDFPFKANHMLLSSLFPDTSTSKFISFGEKCGSEPCLIFFQSTFLLSETTVIFRPKVRYLFLSIYNNYFNGIA